MLIILIWLFILSVALYVIVYIYQIFKKFMNITSTAAERCPSCQQIIHVAGDNDNMVCPKCGTKLGRTKEGKLIIRIN